MRGLTPLRGTWFALMVILVPVLMSTMASATPWQPADPSANPVAEAESLADGASPSFDPSIDATTSEERVDEEVAVDIGNHGQVVRDAHDLTDGVRGCVNRQIAQSDLGKKDAEENGESPVLLEDGALDPDSLDLDCENGTPSPDSSAEAGPKGDSSSNGKADKDSKGNDDPGARNESKKAKTESSRP